MLQKQRYAIIGYGVMGEAILSGLISKGKINPKQITACGPREERRTSLQEKYGINTSKDNFVSASGADVVILAVKPQKIDRVKTLNGSITPGSLVISIIAGVPMQKIIDSPETYGDHPGDAEHTRTDR